MEFFMKVEEKIIYNEPMKNHTSFKIGGVADRFLIVDSEEELKQALEYAKEEKITTTIIGNGSNLLVKDKGIRGLVIKINIQKLKIEKREDYVEIEVGSGYKMMSLAIKLKDEEIAGFEELSGIPGSIGGAIFMNAGAYGKEMKDIIISTKCMDKNGNVFELSNEEQDFSYRASIFNKKKYIILETKIKLQYGKKEEINKKMNEYKEKRKEKQPIDFPSAGSSFKRKEGIITAKLIDDLGLKGFKIGGAKVSEKHAGFIINDGNATAKDVLDLIEYIKKKVYEKYRIHIVEEIRILGED